MTSLPGFLLLLLSPLVAADDAHTVASAGHGWQQQSLAPASARSMPLTGDKTVEHLKATGQYKSLAAAITAARYAVKLVENCLGNRNSELRRPSQNSVGAEVTRLKSPQNQSLLTSAPTVLKEALAQNSAHGLIIAFSPEGLIFTVRSAGFQTGFARSGVASRFGKRRSARHDRGITGSKSSNNRS